MQKPCKVEWFCHDRASRAWQPSSRQLLTPAHWSSSNRILIADGASAENLDALGRRRAGVGLHREGALGLGRQIHHDSVSSNRVGATVGMITSLHMLV